LKFIIKFIINFIHSFLSNVFLALILLGLYIYIISETNGEHNIDEDINSSSIINIDKASTDIMQNVNIKQYTKQLEQVKDMKLMKNVENMDVMKNIEGINIMENVENIDIMKSVDDVNVSSQIDDIKETSNDMMKNAKDSMMGSGFFFGK